MPYPGEQYGVLDCTQLHQVVIPGKVPGLTPVNIPSAGLKKMKGNCVYCFPLHQLLFWTFPWDSVKYLPVTITESVRITVWPRDIVSRVTIIVSAETWYREKMHQNFTIKTINQPLIADTSNGNTKAINQHSIAGKKRIFSRYEILYPRLCCDPHWMAWSRCWWNLWCWSVLL